jgi:hypothetical protein
MATLLKKGLEEENGHQLPFLIPAALRLSKSEIRVSASARGFAAYLRADSTELTKLARVTSAASGPGFRWEADRSAAWRRH